MALHHYLSTDRLQALAEGRELPLHAEGAALLADMCGFTALTESLALRHGERQGAEALAEPVGGVYDALMTQVQAQGGHTLSFAGDAITCWFDATDDAALGASAGQRALQAALAMQQAVQRLAQAEATLALKVSVALGAAHRFTVGDPAIQTLDVLAGPAVAAVALADTLAQPGEVLLDAQATLALQAPVLEWREAASTRFAVVDGRWSGPLPSWMPAPRRARPAVSDEAESAHTPSVEALSAERLRPWVHAFVFERERAGQGVFATDLRPVVALFLSFGEHASDAGKAEDLDRQALHDTIAAAQGLLQQHGGVLLELTLGDQGRGFYAAFGAAQAHEDDACRAARAALALRALLAQAPAGPSRARIGLASGLLRVGGYGARNRQSFGAQGDAANAAARLMMLAQPGEILASGRVRSAVAHAFVLQARTPVQLKGKAEPMPVFALLGPQRQRSARLREVDFVLPMVGREDALQQLDLTLDEAACGQCAWVLVQSDAGMGKSRLLAEGTRLALRRGFVGYSGGSGSATEAPYAAWHTIWADLLEIDLGGSQRAMARDAEAALARLAPQHAEAWPLLGAALGVRLPDNAFTQALAPQDRKGLLEALLVQALRSAANEAAQGGSGLLLQLEDLHAADAMSLDLLAAVLRTAGPVPLVLWLSQRPPERSEPAGPHAPPASPIRAEHERVDVARALSLLPAQPGRRRPDWQIALPALNVTQVELMIRAKLAALFPERTGRVPAALIERLTSQAQGNPFYVEALLNHLHDRGLDPHRVDTLAQLDWPSSLRSLVLSRIDRLPAPQPMVVKAASVLGPSFSLSALQACHAGAATDDATDTAPWRQALLSHVQALVHAGLAEALPDDGEPTFRFTHRVTQEVAYDSIAQPGRLQLHRRVAEHLAQAPLAQGQAGSSRAQMLAHHWLRAACPEQAWPHLLRAGEEAAASYANDQALAAYTQALECLPPSAVHERVTALLRRESLCELMGRHDARHHDLAALALLAGRLPAAAATALRAQLALRQARLQLDLGDFAAAEAGAQAALTALAAFEGLHPHPEGSVPDILEALLLQARALFAAGQAESARAPLHRQRQLAQAHGLLRAESRGLALLGLVEWQLGHYDTAEAQLLAALPGLQQAGDLRHELDVHNNLGVVAKARGRLTHAVACYERALAIARRIGDRSGQAILLNNMGSTCLAAGDFERAAHFAEQAAAIWAASQERSQHGVALLNRAEAHRELGQYAAAQALGEQALAALRASGARRTEAVVLENLGRVCMAVGDAPGAHARLGAALKLAREIGLRAIEASSSMDLGRLHTLEARFDRADQALRHAAALMDELGDALGACEVQAARAEWALAPGQPEREAKLRAARTALEPLLSRLLGPGDEASQALSGLPMPVVCVAWRLLQACGDTAADALGLRAQTELRARAARITDPALRRDYLHLAEHRALHTDPPAHPQEQGTP